MVSGQKIDNSGNARIIDVSALLYSVLVCSNWRSKLWKFSRDLFWEHSMFGTLL